MDLNKAYQLISQKLIIWIRELITLLPNIAVATIILVAGFFLSRTIRNLSGRIFHRISHNETIRSLLSSLVYIFLCGVTIFAALTVLRLDKAVTSILAGAGIIGLALAFAFQDIAANFMSGIFLSLRRPIRVGDIVQIKDFTGKVEEVNLRDTMISTFQGQMVIIPNKDVFQNPIENFSLLGIRRIDLTVGISYGDDLDKVKSVALAAVSGMEGLSKERETSLYFQEFGDSSITFMLRLWVKYPGGADYNQVRSDAIVRIKKAFDENGITMPFPVRTLDFGIKGGVSLDQVALSLKR